MVIYVYVSGQTPFFVNDFDYDRFRANFNMMLSREFASWVQYWKFSAIVRKNI